MTRHLVWLAMFLLPACMLNRDEVFRADGAPPSGDRELTGGDSSAGDPVAGDPAAGDPAGTPYALTVDPSTKSATVPQGAQMSFQVALAEELARQVSWTASSNQTWLGVTPTSGTTPSTLTLDARTAALSLGGASATVTIDLAPPGPGSGTSVTVSLEVVPPFAAGFDALGGPAGGKVTGIVVDPNDSQRILAAAEEYYDEVYAAQILLSEDGGITFRSVHLELAINGGWGVLDTTGRGYWALAFGGIYRTDDSGETWSPAGLRYADVWTVAASSLDPDLVLTVDGTSIQKSINGGVDWTPISLAGNAQAILNDPTTPGMFFAGDDLGNIYWTDGTTFDPIPIDGDACGNNCAATALGVSPTTGRWVVANNWGAIAITDNQGGTWTWSGGGALGDVAALLFDANDTLWATTWYPGDVFTSVNGGVNFSSVQSPDIAIGGTWPLALHPNGLLVGHEIAGLLRHESGTGLVQTGLMAHGVTGLDYRAASGELAGISSTSAVFRWSRTAGFENATGDEYFGDAWLADLSMDPADPEGMLLAGFNLGVLRTANGGATWTPCLGIADHSYSLSRAPEDATVVWAGADDGLYRSTNNGVSFTRVATGSVYGVAAVSASSAVYSNGSNVFRITPPGAATMVVNESVFRVLRAADGSIFVADSDVGIQRSTDGGLNFEPLGLAGAAPWDIEVDPNNPDRIYAAFFELGDVLVSSDGGDNWAPMGAPASIIGLAIDPVSGALFLGSHNAGVLTWSE